MAASSATYAARKTDTGAVISATLGALQYGTAVQFMAKHQSDTTAAKIDVAGVVDNPSTGEVHVVLDCTEYRVGLYDCAWEDASGAPLLMSVPASGGETFEILESLR